MPAPVLVTGGSGFVASHLVRQLLEDGYAVRATVRNQHSMNLSDPPGAPGVSG